MVTRFVIGLGDILKLILFAIFLLFLFNPTTGEWSADHKRISGSEFTDLYGDFGRMSAVYTRTRGGKPKWVVRQD